MSLTKSNVSYAAFLSSMDMSKKDSGSGFRLTLGEREFIVTAKHVIYDKKDNLRNNEYLCTSQNYLGGSLDTFMMSIDLTKSIITLFQNVDLVLIELIKDKSYYIQQTGNDITTVKMDDLLPLNKIQIAADVIQVGFPTSLYITRLNFFDVNKPLLRKGIVAGIHEKDNTFIIDCPAYYGNSGGPIVQIDEKNNLKVIGIVSRYIPFITEWRNKHERELIKEEFHNSGYAICVPLDLVISKILPKVPVKKSKNEHSKK